MGLGHSLPNIPRLSPRRGLYRLLTPYSLPRQRRPYHGGNEAEHFIMAILRGNKFFAILREDIFWHFRGEKKF